MRVAPQRTRSHHEIGHKPGRLNSTSGNDYFDRGRPAERFYLSTGRVLAFFHVLRKPPASQEDEAAASDPRKINIVLNWFEELKERVPVD